MKEPGYCEGCDRIKMIETERSRPERGFCSSCQKYYKEQIAKLPPGCLTVEEMFTNTRNLNVTVAILRIRHGNAGPADFVRYEVAS